jgi:predicted AlkP superfamily pyrophosphatase or phosphodiesterase
MKLMEPDYTHSILNVSHTILNHYGCKTNRPVIDKLKTVLDKNYKHVFLILLDGMGTNVIKKHLTKKDFLKKHMIDKITSIYPPTTVAATHSILTAKPPYESGYLGWTQYFPKEDVYDIIFLNQDYYDKNKVIEENLKEKYLKHELIFERIEKANSNVKTQQLFPSFVKGGYDTFEDQIEEAIKISQTNERTFSYLYWINPDDLEHKYGPMSKEVKVELKNLSKDVAQLAKEMHSDSVIIVMADHGQIPVKPIEFCKTKYLCNMLDKKPSLEPRTPTFFVKKDKKLEFRMMFKKMYETRFQLYSKAEFLESGLLGDGVKHPMLDQFLGDYVALAINDSYLKFKPTAVYKGHHAGLTKGEMEVPLIVYEKK